MTKDQMRLQKLDSDEKVYPPTQGCMRYGPAALAPAEKSQIDEAFFNGLEKVSCVGKRIPNLFARKAWANDDTIQVNKDAPLKYPKKESWKASLSPKKTKKQMPHTRVTFSKRFTRRVCLDFTSERSTFWESVDIKASLSSFYTYIIPLKPA
jgi:hypothetical protein